MADFRLCSTSRSHSRAGLYHYAHEQKVHALATYEHMMLMSKSEIEGFSHMYVVRDHRAIGSTYVLGPEWSKFIKEDHLKMGMKSL